MSTINALFWVVLVQYIPRLLRIIPVTRDLKRTAGVFIETAWAGAAYYLLWFMLAGHVSASCTMPYHISVVVSMSFTQWEPEHNRIYFEFSVICEISPEVLPLSSRRYLDLGTRIMGCVCEWNCYIWIEVCITILR